MPNIPILLEHYKEIGHLIYAKQDDFGLYIIFAMSEDVCINMGNIFLSIGFQTLSSFKVDNKRYINYLNLCEISIVKKPASIGVICQKLFPNLI